MDPGPSHPFGCRIFQPRAIPSEGGRGETQVPKCAGYITDAYKNRHRHGQISWMMLDDVGLYTLCEYILASTKHIIYSHFLGDVIIPFAEGFIH